MDVRSFYSKAQIMAAGETALRAQMVAQFNTKVENIADQLCQTSRGIMTLREAALDSPAEYLSSINGDMNRGTGHHKRAQKKMVVFNEAHKG